VIDVLDLVVEEVAIDHPVVQDFSEPVTATEQELPDLPSDP
jgi:hypothetical protein